MSTDKFEGPGQSTDNIARVSKSNVSKGVHKLWVGSSKRLPKHVDETGAAWVVDLMPNMGGKADRLLLYTEPQSDYYRIIRKGQA